jgi:hypothetical protein
MSAMIGADYSAGRPGGAALAAAGVKVVGRYAAAGRTSININAAEVADLRAHGIDVFIYNEHEASYMMGGAARAATVAPAAVKVCRDAGLPDGPIFYAVDWDATLGGAPTSATALANMRALADFLTGAARVTSWDVVGVYGGYYVIKWLLDNLPNLKHAVQTSAWSAGRWDSRAFCRQDGYNWMINGVNCDHLTVVNPDEGSLRYRKGGDDVPLTDAEWAKLTGIVTGTVRQVVTDLIPQIGDEVLGRGIQTWDGKRSLAYLASSAYREAQAASKQAGTIANTTDAVRKAVEDSPTAQEIADAVAAIHGTGPGGTLTREDVMSALTEVVSGTHFVAEATPGSGDGPATGAE